jgi:[acyl-carrier-protein] S-malonyltransferase
MHDIHLAAAAVFPGQGSQGPAMGLPWRDHPAWTLVERAEQQLHRDLSWMLLDPGHPPFGTRDAHLSVALCSMMAWSSLRPGFTPVVLAGHSLGLLPALYAAGVLSAADTIAAVAARAYVCARASARTPGGMTAVLGPAALAREACAGVDCWVASDNSPAQTVIAGTRDGLRVAMARASLLGAADVIPLYAEGAFHCPLTRDAVAEFAGRLAGMTFRPASTVLIHNAHVHRPGDGTDWAALVAADLATPVRWRETQLAFGRYGVDTVVSVGFGRTLTSLARRTLPDVRLHNVSSPQSSIDAILLAMSAELAPL